MKSKFLDLNRLEFFTTSICNSKCKHCSVINKNSEEKHIDIDVAINLIKKLSSRYDLQSVMTFGGEPLLFPEVIYSIHKAAKNLGIPSRQIITNGYWSKDDDKIQETVDRLEEVGVNKILISVDAFHQEHIPIEIVKKVTKKLLKTSISDIKLSPCWVVSEEDDNFFNKKTKSILEEFKDLSIKVGSGNVVSPQGAALKNLNKYLPNKKLLEDGKCGDLPYTDTLDSIKSLSVEPNGDMIICKNFKIGNAEDENIEDTLEKYNPYNNIYMKTILEDGVQGLLKLADREGIEIEEREFYSICDKCTYLKDKLISK
ncbi:radical SAM protein [Dethiothermospora halolimnae]|uniref:radical SAM protein n=1 Tax=Dethiothermospora halolimnae TaxID=3114390 RepID=UPI003CCB784F